MVYTIVNQRKIGSGSYGDVYVVEDETGKKMAVKIIDPKKLSYVELDILTRLKSPYILRSVGDPIIEIQHSKGITLQLKENCISRLDTRRLPYYQLKRIMICCLFGLRCMHSKGFLHNDLVSRNILFDKDEDDNYLAYLADFSVSIRCIDAKKGVSVKTIVKGSHTPIEILQGIKYRKKNFVYNDKTDVWSLGLCFLELISKKKVFSSDSEQLDCYNGIDRDYIKGKVKLYAKNFGDKSRKINAKEELYLTELLSHMLKRNPKDRMCSDEITRLNFVKTTSIPYDCSLNKPSELMIVPHVGKNIKEGISLIRKFFSEKSFSTLSSYFLAIQIYVRIMKKAILEESDYDMKGIVDISVRTARNYYDKSIVAGYEGGILLRGEIGYNPYFYGANYLEELVLIDYYIDNSENFLAMLESINPHDIFHQFRMMYSYDDSNRITNLVTYERFKSIQKPEKNDSRSVKIYLPSEYSNIDDIISGKSSIQRESEIEEIFNGMIIDHIKNQVRQKFSKDFPNIYQLALDYVQGSTQIKRKEIYSKIRENDIFTTMMGINEYFDYGLIKIEMGNVVKNIFHDKDFVIISSKEKTSLIHVDKENMVVTHYYSEPDKTVEELYKDDGYEYKVNFEQGINNCCKVVDSCVLFVVFYNRFLKKEEYDFEMKCISEETNFVIFLSLFL